jgi:nucleotide-binding universal stress UspA family protein
VSGSIERVVVPLDAASENREAIDTAARLAAHAKVPLHGVFVEDEDLLRLARLPFVRHVMPGPGIEPLSVETIERQLRAAAERARKELAAAATRHRIDWSFEVVRRANGPLLVAAGERDLVVAGALSRPVGGHFRVEWRGWSAIASVPGPLLLAQRGWDPSGPVLAVLRDRRPGSARLLDVAAQLAAAAGGALTVICPPELAKAEGFEAWLAERIAPYSVRLQIEVAPAEPADLERRLAELGCRVLAVHSGDGERSERLRALFGRLACDILVVC